MDFIFMAAVSIFREVKQASSVVGWFSCAPPTREVCVLPSPSMHTLCVGQQQFYNTPTKNFGLDTGAANYRVARFHSIPKGSSERYNI